jgi:hypothetical protein
MTPIAQLGTYAPPRFSAILLALTTDHLRGLGSLQLGAYL